MKNPEGHSPNYYDLTVQIRDGGYLSDSRKLGPYKNNSGYIISAKTKIDNFIKEFKVDFEEDIFPQLDKMKTVKDCINHYENFSFWGEQLKRIIKGHGLSHLP